MRISDWSSDVCSSDLWLGLVYWLNPHFLWWLLPVAGSLVIAIPLSVWSSRRAIGVWTRSARLFLIPEESITPRELRALKAGLRRAPRYPDFVPVAREPAATALPSLVGRHPKLAHETSQLRLRHLADAEAPQHPGPPTESESKTPTT